MILLNRFANSMGVRRFTLQMSSTPVASKSIISFLEEQLEKQPECQNYSIIQSLFTSFDACMNVMI